MAYDTFPELSRAPQMDIEEEPDDPTQRDKMANGAVATRPNYTRIRDTLKVNYKLLTSDDRRAVRDFRNQVGGWTPFYWTDNRDPANPEQKLVRFSKLPKITDDTYAGGCKRFKVQFEIQEV